MENFTERRKNGPYEEISAIKSDIAVLKSNVNQIYILLEKFDTTVEKFLQVSNEINRVTSLHDAQISQLDKEEEEIQYTIQKSRDDFRKEITIQVSILNEKLDKMSEFQRNHHDHVSAEIEKLNKRVMDLERWKWFVVGIGFAIGFAAQNFLNI